MTDDGHGIDSFDDLFEPFELDEPPEPGHEPPPPEPEGHYIACPSCGTRNPTVNRHCEACGARVAQGPLPVAPQPMLRTTPGARALGILTAVVLVVALLALVVNLFGGDDEPSATGADGGTGTSVPSTGPTTPTLAIEKLTPTNVLASSELPAFPAGALIDDDPTTSWNDASLKGEGAELQFFFAEPVQISQIVIQNVEDEARFTRNYRIRGVEITVDDLATTIIRTLEDTRARQTIDIGSLETRTVVVKVTDTYAAAPFGGEPPFEELALQEVSFFGRASPSASGG